MKSQAGLEYLIIASFALFVIGVIFYYSFTSSSETISYNQARESVDQIAKAVDHVYALGPGSRTTVSITIPSNVVNTSVSGNIITVSISIRGKEIDLIAIPKANVTGGIPNATGSYQINISRINGNVKIG